MIETEVKVLEIDIPVVKARLRRLGARKIFEGPLHARAYSASRRRARGSPIARVRQEGRRAVLAYKGTDRSRRAKSKEELETEIADFALGCQVLERLGLRCFADIRKRRIEYSLGRVNVALDQIPGMPAYLEIEGSSLTAIFAAAARLGFAGTQCLPWGGSELYAHYGKSYAPRRRRL